jgi:hypothetical protein
MSSFLRGLWANTYGLLVDDGQLAIGAIVGLALTWLASRVVDPALLDDVGWLLVIFVVALVIANTYRAGRNARRRAG